MKIVFDFGGVLFRWRPQQLVRHALPRQAADDPGAAHWAAQIFHSNAGDWADFDRGRLGPAELVERVARRTGLAAAEVQRLVDAVPHELQPLPESVALLRRLAAAGSELYFLSNMPAPYARRLQAEHDFVALFRDGVFSGDVGHVKPEPEIFALAARRFGPPQHLVFIDDLEINVLAARAHGWQALHFTGAAQAAEDLRRLGVEVPV